MPGFSPGFADGGDLSVLAGVGPALRGPVAVHPRVSNGQHGLGVAGDGDSHPVSGFFPPGLFVDEPIGV